MALRKDKLRNTGVREENDALISFYTRLKSFSFRRWYNFHHFSLLYTAPEGMGLEFVFNSIQRDMVKIISDFITTLKGTQFDLQLIASFYGTNIRTQSVYWLFWFILTQTGKRKVWPTDERFPATCDK